MRQLISQRKVGHLHTPIVEPEGNGRLAVAVPAGVVIVGKVILALSLARDVDDLAQDEGVFG